MANFYWVRHGQASFDSDNYDQLSTLGHQQSEWLGEYFKARNIDFAAVVSGDLVRHIETAEGIFAGLGSTHEIDLQPGLNEFDFRGLAQAYLATHPQAKVPSRKDGRRAFYQMLKEAMFAWIDGRLDGENIETWDGFKQRISDALAHIRTQYHNADNVLIVSSGGVIGTFGHLVWRTDPNSMVEMNMQIYNSGISQGFFNEHVFRLGTFNHVPHLDTRERQEAVTYS